MAETAQTDFTVLFQPAAAKDPRFALAVGYARGDDVPTLLASGPLHIGSAQDVGTKSPWHIGSITKSFTATLILMLVERGRLELDTPIDTYLADSEMHADWRRRTLRQLLSHTAGLPSNATLLQMLKSETDDPSQDRLAILRPLWSRRAPAAPGGFAYSNIGYALAGHIAEQVTGKRWETLIRSEIAEPLGLASLGFGPPRGGDAPWGHRSVLGFKRPVDPNGKKRADNPAWMGPAGRLHMALGDLIIWGQAHLQARRGGGPKGFLSAESCRTMQTDVAESYGLGWVVQPRDGADQPLIWHNGSNTMWYAILMLAPGPDVALAVAVNAYQPARIDALAKQMMTVLVG